MLQRLVAVEAAITVAWARGASALKVGIRLVGSNRWRLGQSRGRWRGSGRHR